MFFFLLLLKIYLADFPLVNMSYKLSPVLVLLFSRSRSVTDPQCISLLKFPTGSVHHGLPYCHPSRQLFGNSPYFVELDKIKMNVLVYVNVSCILWRPHPRLRFACLGSWAFWVPLRAWIWALWWRNRAKMMLLGEL